MDIKKLFFEIILYKILVLIRCFKKFSVSTSNYLMTVG